MTETGEKVMEIFKLIPQVMGEIGSIGKDRKNIQQGYSFRGIDDVYNAVNAALSKHGVFCAPTVLDMTREERQTQKGGTLLYTILKVKYSFYAGDGSSVECVTIGEAMDSGDKSCNKAMSAAQKYAFLQVFCIPTQEPKDTEEETHNIKGKHTAIPAPEVPSGGPPATSPPKGKTSNYDFLKVMGEQKKRVGERAYYVVLGKHGFEKSDQITDREIQVKVFNDLKEIAAE